jgi:uncharacterized protein YydD (DUF2326 family)
MQLISLSANKPTFKTVKFNKEGLNFIVAKQKNPGESEKGQTFNGVGKSLLVSIVHFCLGARKTSYKIFCEKLPAWQFTLEFQVGQNILTALRSTSEPDKIILDGEELSVGKFNEKMAGFCFDIPATTQFLSFRSLLPFFVRPRRESYMAYDKPSKTGAEYQNQLYNSFLMGLNIDLVQEKKRIRTEQERVKDLTSNFEKDELLREFFFGNKDVSLTLKDIDDSIKKLETDIEKFQVAADYYDVRSEGDQCQRRLEDIQNQIVLIESQIKNIGESLKTSPDLGQQTIRSIYEESKIVFPEGIKKNLIEMENFYEQLSKNRIKKLTQQKVEIQNKLQTTTNEKMNLQKKLDEKMQYLGAHHALDVFVKMNQKLADIRNEKSNLQKYDNLIEEYHKSNLNVKEELLNATKRTDEYLKDVKQELNDLRDYFRDLAKRFYPNSVSGITVYNNDGENQLRFNIEAKIEADASDGINNVKIFCYDLTLLFKGFGHSMNFVFHDSRILHGIDPRQQVELFKIANEMFSQGDRQYIMTVNQNQLDEIRQNWSSESFDAVINKNIVLTLMDSSDSEKLLGITVDIPPI